ncbi:ABC transporter permease [Rubrimonas sp.]|uniref:ABC transporter permease n=1 Tax=Rubrimonas sp. TaxID=2036015 RepID=UPI002FDE398D
MSGIGIGSRGALRIAGYGLAALGGAVGLLPGPTPLWALVTLTCGAALALWAGGPLGAYILRRIAAMLGTLLVVSALVFLIITLPPGDYLSNQIAELRATGQESGVAQAEFLVAEYALDRPLPEQYLIWLGLWPGPRGFSGILQGHFGQSFALDRPVLEIVGEAMAFTLGLNLAVVLFVYALALPLGVIGAMRAGTWIDRTVSVVSYLGLATPNFLLALLLMYYGNKAVGLPIGGGMAREFIGQPLSVEKLGSILLHLIAPVFVIGTAAVAGMSQRLRANLLDELGKPYVVTARAKGLGETRAVLKYPLRVALNPFIADIGNLLPQLVSGAVLVSVVMSLPTIGPILLSALRSQDVFLSGFILLFVSALTLVGMLLSDLLLALVDPRIRLGA